MTEIIAIADSEKQTMKIRPVFLAVLGFVLAYVGFGFIHDRKLQDGFDSVRSEVSEQSVHDAMGAPSAIDRSCAAYGTQLSETCDHVLIYHSALAPLRSSYWLVFVDADGRTKATSRQIRP
jgi:hypothetical protein